MCDKPATTQCEQCGMPLCEEHMTHGIQFRTNNPTIHCPNCESNITRLTKRIILVLTIGLIIGVIFLIWYLDSVFYLF